MILFVGLGHRDLFDLRSDRLAAAIADRHPDDSWPLPRNHVHVVDVTDADWPGVESMVKSTHASSA